MNPIPGLNLEINDNFSMSNSMELQWNCSSPDNLDDHGGIFMTFNCYVVTPTALAVNFVSLTIGALTIVLNAVVLRAIWKHESLCEVMDVLIAALALADAFGGGFLIYQTLYNIGNWQVLAECLIRFGITLGSNLSSVFHMGFLTFDCYVKIASPYLYRRWFRPFPVKCVSLVLWIAAFGIGFLPVFGWRLNPKQPPICGFFALLPSNYRLLIVSLFLVPPMASIFIYSHIFRIAKYHVKNIGKQSRVTKFKKSWKITKTVFFLAGFYFLCWIPTGIFIIVEYHIPLDMTAPQKGTMVMYLTALGYINGLFNPVIYAMKIPYIKEEFRRGQRWLTCISCTPTVSPHTDSSRDTQ